MTVFGNDDAIAGIRYFVHQLQAFSFKFGRFDSFHNDIFK
jgi:hypothetical protein